MDYERMQTSSEQSTEADRQLFQRKDSDKDSGLQGRTSDETNNDIKPRTIVYPADDGCIPTRQSTSDQLSLGLAPPTMLISPVEQSTAPAEELQAAPMQFMSTVRVQSKDGKTQHVVSYLEKHVIGSGSFGQVLSAVLLPSNEPIAIKTVLQDRRFMVCNVTCGIRTNRPTDPLCPLRHRTASSSRFRTQTTPTSSACCSTSSPQRTGALLSR
jgi:hypothetical protein